MGGILKLFGHSGTIWLGGDAGVKGSTSGKLDPAFSNEPCRRSPQVDLRILATTDLHMHLMPFDYFRDKAIDKRGLALTSGLISAEKQSATNWLLVDNGDFLQGSPIGDYVALSGFSPHPMISAMNALGYDAVNLGNHEFSHGLSYLVDAMREAEFPFVSGNVFWRKSGLPLTSRTLLLSREVLDRDGAPHILKIGITGAMPSQANKWDSAAIGEELDITPMLPAISDCIGDLKDRGADVVVILAHTGPGSAAKDGTDEGAGHALSQLSGVDALILGHVHEIFPKESDKKRHSPDARPGHINGIPTVLPGAFGSYLGIIDLKLELMPTGWKVSETAARLRPVCDKPQNDPTSANLCPDIVVQSIALPAHEETRRWARREISLLPARVHSYFAMVSDCPSTRLINEAQASHVMAKLRGTAWENLPVLAAAAPFKAGGRAGPENYCDIPAGKLLLRHAADLYVHPNTISALLLTGAEVKKWLEHSARVFLPIHPKEQDQPLLDPARPSFDFDTIHGVTYEIDLTRPLDRIRNLAWNGRAVTVDQLFVLATSNYRSAGNGGFFCPRPEKVIFSDNTPAREVLVRHLERGGAQTIWKPPAWRLTATGGTTVLFDTSPSAGDCLVERLELDVAPVCLTDSGFLRMRLRF